jgi:hypothetical protein
MKQFVRFRKLIKQLIKSYDTCIILGSLASNHMKLASRFVKKLASRNDSKLLIEMMAATNPFEACIKSGCFTLSVLGYKSVGNKRKSC